VNTQSLGAPSFTQYNAIAPSAPIQDLLSAETHEFQPVPSIVHALKSLPVILQNISCVHGRIILKSILKNGMLTEISWYCGNETAGAIKGVEFVNNWNYCWCLNKYFAACNKVTSE